MELEINMQNKIIDFYTYILSWMDNEQVCGTGRSHNDATFFVNRS